MSDGPFSHAGLAACHLKALESLGDPSFSDKERSNILSHAVVTDVTKSGAMAFIQDWFASDVNGTLPGILDRDLDETLAKHGEPPFVHMLKQEIDYSHDSDMLTGHWNVKPLDRALKRQLDGTCQNLEAVILKTRELGKISADKAVEMRRNLNPAKEGVSIRGLRKELLTEKDDAFKSSVAKRQGVDQGPAL